MNNSERPNRFRKRQTSLLTAGHFINDMYCGFLAPLLPLLMLKYDLSLTRTAALATVLSITASFIQPLQGYLADKLGKHYFVALGPLLTAAFLSMIGLAPDYGTLVVLLILGGIGTSMFHPQAASMVVSASGPRQGLGMSVFVTGGTLGVAVAPMIIMGVVSLWGLEKSWITIFPGIVIAVLLLRYSPAIVPHHQNVRAGTLDHHPRRNRYLFLGLLTGMSVLRATVIVTLNNFSPLYMTKIGFGPEIAALSVSVLLLAGGIGSFLGGIISDWMGRKLMLALSLIFSIPFSVLYVWTPGWPKFIFLALAGFSLSASLPVTVLIAQGIAPKRTGLASSLMMGFCWGIAGLMLTPLGALAEHIGLESMLFIVALLPLIALLLVFPIPKIANS